VLRAYRTLGYAASHGKRFPDTIYTDATCASGRPQRPVALLSP